MNTSSTPQEKSWPTTVRFCEVCTRHTAHELRPGRVVCVRCIDQMRMRELDRE